jgi:hypothetical protein
LSTFDAVAVTGTPFEVSTRSSPAPTLIRFRDESLVLHFDPPLVEETNASLRRGGLTVRDGDVEAVLAIAAHAVDADRGRAHDIVLRQHGGAERRAIRQRVEDADVCRKRRGRGEAQ